MVASSSIQDPTSALVESLVGTLLLDRFRVLEPLGVGGMAMVFLAEHATIHKKCAVKVLLPEHASKPVLVERFLREARAASTINHENVVEITDYGQTDGGLVFFIMELLDGEDLADKLAREGRIPWPRARAVVLQICRALATAHAHGIVHRDMKPENVFLVRRHGVEEFVKVLDFGIAKVLSETGEGRSLTKTGVIVGTPEYLSPEQGEGDLEVDARADIYALGVIMYEMLTGEVPFRAETFAKLLSKHLFEAPRAPSMVAPDAEIPPEVEAIILKALQKDREFRFQSCGELARAIEAVGTGAAPVEVVAEQRVQPQVRGAAMSYAEGASPTIAAQPLDAPATPTNWRMIAVALVVGLGAAALLLGRQQDGPETSEANPASAPTGPAPEPEAPEPEPAEPATVRVRLTTNVDARIIDLASGAVLGQTNTPEGLLLDHAETPRELVLRAEGHEDLPLNLVPAIDIASTHELVPVEPQTKKKKPKHKGSKKNAKKSDPFSLLPVNK